MAGTKSGWGTAKETAEAHKGSTIFVRLENDGDKVVGTFVGEPITRELCWNPKKEAYEDFTPEAAAAGLKSTPRFAMNFFVPAAGNEPAAMKVLEMNLNTFKDVLKCKDKYGLGSWFFEIERSGKKGDPKTQYSVLPERQLTAAEQAACGKPGPNDSWVEGSLKLHDLHKAIAGDDDKGGDSKTDMNSHDKAAAAPAAPASAFIASELASALVARCKLLPKDKLDKFLGKFGVTKIKEIKASDADSAQAFLSELEGKPAAASTAVDPFAD